MPPPPMDPEVMTYNHVLLTLLVAQALPSLVLCWFWRPRSWQDFKERQWSWIAGALGLDATRRIIILVTSPLGTPHGWVQWFTIGMFIMIVTSLWAILIREISHKKMERDDRNTFRSYLYRPGNTPIGRAAIAIRRQELREATRPAPLAEKPVLPPPDRPTKQRPGDQVLPTANDLPFVSDELQNWLERRKQIGIQRYGTPLQPHNGRDATMDAFEEAADLATYLAQVIIERDGKLPE